MAKKKKEKGGLFRKKQTITPEMQEQERVKTFLDMYLPGNVTLYSDYIIQDSTYRTIWVIKAYPPLTRDQAILAELGRSSNITLHIIADTMNGAEESKIIRQASERNRSVVNTSTDTQTNIKAQQDFQDIQDMIVALHRNHESLIKTTVYIEMYARDLETLNTIRSDVRSMLQSEAITFDELKDRQEQAYLSLIPGGRDQFKGAFSRALPQISTANLYPFSYTGKNDGAKAMFIGKDANGSYIFVDPDKRDSTHTNSNIAVLGNSGMGKSYLTKGLIVNFAETGKRIIILDPEHEYEDLIKDIGGSYIELTDGNYMINIMEPKSFSKPDDGETADSLDMATTKTYTTSGMLSQHISFLRDFFKIYKSDLSGTGLDILEVLLTELYENEFNITNNTDIAALSAKHQKDLQDAIDHNYPIDEVEDPFPTLSDLYNYAYKIYQNFDQVQNKYMFTSTALRNVLLAIQSICQGSQSRYFNGHTNIVNTNIVAFGMKGIMEADESLKNAMLFNVLSYMSDKALNQRNTVCVLDEFYLFLGSPISVTYCRNLCKRARKYDSSILIASQNIDDFMKPDIASQTKPLLEIPTHKFLFNPGSVNIKEFMELLQMQPNEYQIIQTPRRGFCLYMCGNERYSLMVHFPGWKSALFGSGGGN